MNWPPVSFEPPIRQSDRLSGVMILAMISSSIVVAVVVLVVHDEDLGGPLGDHAELDGAVERDREAVGGEEVHRRRPAPRLNRFERQSTRLTRVS